MNLVCRGLSGDLSGATWAILKVCWATLDASSGILCVLRCLWGDILVNVSRLEAGSWSSSGGVDPILRRPRAPGPPNSHLAGTSRGLHGDLPGTSRGAAGGPNRQFGLRRGELKGGNLTRLMTPQGGRRICVRRRVCETCVRENFPQESCVEITAHCQESENTKAVLAISVVSRWARDTIKIN